LEPGTIGMQHMVLVATAGEGFPQSFTWLEQPSIQKVRDVRRGERGFESDLEKLFAHALYGEGNTRAIKEERAANYAIRTISWQFENSKAVGKPGQQGRLIPQADTPRLVIDPTESIDFVGSSPNGERLITVSANYTGGEIARLWETKAGHQLGEYVVEFGGGSQSRAAGSGFARATLSADGKQLAAKANVPGRVKIWDLSSNDVLWNTALTDGSLSEFTKELAKRTQDGALNEAYLYSLVGGHPMADGRSVWMNINGTVTLFDVSAGMKPIRSLDVIGTGYRIKDLAFSPDNLAAATGHNDGKIAIWDVREKRLTKCWKAHDGVVEQIMFDRAGRHVVSWGSDHHLRRWEIATAREVGKLKVPAGPNNNDNLEASFSTDGALAVTKSVQEPSTGYFAGTPLPTTLSVWNFEENAQIANRKLESSLSRPRFTAEGTALLAPVFRNGFYAWLNPRDLQEPQTSVRFEYDYYNADVHLGRKLVATIGAKKDDYSHEVVSLRMWESGQLLRTLQPNGGQKIEQVRFSLDGKYIAADVSARSHIVWDTDTGSIVLTCPNQRFKRWSADGRFLTTFEAIDNSTIRYRCWDLSERTTVGEFSTGDHTDGGHRKLRGIDLSEDGSKLLTFGEEGELRIWDVGTAKIVKRINAHREPIAAAALSPDGRQALSASGRDAVKLWDLESGRSIRSFELVGLPCNGLGFLRDGAQVFISDARVIRLYHVD